MARRIVGCLRFAVHCFLAGFDKEMPSFTMSSWMTLSRKTGYVSELEAWRHRARSSRLRHILGSDARPCCVCISGNINTTQSLERGNVLTAFSCRQRSSSTG